MPNPREPVEVSDDLARVLTQLAKDDEKKAGIEQLVKTDSRPFSQCRWLGTCYYCFFAGKWWLIGCI